jgi:glycosyltransferase involved in cell wall biosynthesis
MNILTLSTYPIETARHGGQVRLRSIVEVLLSAGHNVEVAGVLGSNTYPSSDTFEPCPDREILATQLDSPTLMEDWAIGRLYYSDTAHFERLARRIQKLPDLIHVEQPWLFAFADRFVREKCRGACKIIYGSANIEHRLKGEIARNILDAEKAEVYSDLVLETETHAIERANGIVCVSENDLEWTKSISPTSVVLAPNGVKAWKSTRAGRQLANNITGNRQIALFCASAHPPNISGFFSMFSGGVGCVNSDQAIVLAGGAADHILASPKLNQSAGLSRSLIRAGVVDDSCLHGLLDVAHSVILPITQGGGTNIKAAEALWSGKHVISTNVGLRGFDKFKDSPGVHVADSPSAFKNLMRAAFEQPPNTLSGAEREARDSLVWERCLQPLVSFVAQIAG